MEIHRIDIKRDTVKLDFLKLGIADPEEPRPFMHTVRVTESGLAVTTNGHVLHGVRGLAVPPGVYDLYKQVGRNEYLMAPAEAPVIGNPNVPIPIVWPEGVSRLADPANAEPTGLTIYFRNMDPSEAQMSKDVSALLKTTKVCLGHGYIRNLYTVGTRMKVSLVVNEVKEERSPLPPVRFDSEDGNYMALIMPIKED